MIRTFLAKEWNEGEIGEGGIFYRDVNLNAFLELVERTKGKVLGIKIEDNNLEVFFKPNIVNVKAGRGGKE